MSEPIVAKLIATAQVGTATSCTTTVAAATVNNTTVALLGLFFTVVFGTLGLAVSFYFKNKEYKVAVAEFKAKHDGRHPDSFE